MALERGNRPGYIVLPVGSELGALAASRFEGGSAMSATVRSPKTRFLVWLLALEWASACAAQGPVAPARFRGAQPVVPSPEGVVFCEAEEFAVEKAKILNG